MGARIRRVPVPPLRRRNRCSYQLAHDSHATQSRPSLYQPAMRTCIRGACRGRAHAFAIGPAQPGYISAHERRGSRRNGATRHHVRSRGAQPAPSARAAFTKTRTSPCKIPLTTPAPRLRRFGPAGCRPQKCCATLAPGRKARCLRNTFGSAVATPTDKRGFVTPKFLGLVRMYRPAMVSGGMGKRATCAARLNPCFSHPAPLLR